MATRCNIIVRIGQTIVYLYRHWDGYPAETGADLCTKLRAAESLKVAGNSITREAIGSHLLLALLSEKRVGDGYDADRAQYEVTTEIHGDVQWIYEFDFTEAQREDLYIPITVRERPRFSDWDDPSKWPVVYHKNTDEFAQQVNAERDLSNKRLAALARKDKAYADATPYDLIPIFGD